MVIFHIVFSYVYQMEKPSGKHGLLKNPTIYTSIIFPDRRFPSQKRHGPGRRVHDAVILWMESHFGFQMNFAAAKMGHFKEFRMTNICHKFRHLQTLAAFRPPLCDEANANTESWLCKQHLGKLYWFLTQKEMKETCSGSISFNVETQCHKATIWGWLLYHPFMVSHRGWFMASALPHNIQHLIISN